MEDYSRSKRILKTDEFSAVFRLRPVRRSAHFVLYARRNQLGHARLGIVVAKRLAPRAVTRNTIKRTARELFRRVTLPAVDCVVRLSQPVNSKSDAAAGAGLKVLLHKELRQLLASQWAIGGCADVVGPIAPTNAR
jgi:ribonuclease P protein component